MELLIDSAQFVLLLLFICVVVFFAIIIVRGKRRERIGLSRDDAEFVAIDRIPKGYVVGARFTDFGANPVWEFDIREGETIHRVQVGATLGKILNEQDLPVRERLGPEGKVNYGTKLPY